MTYERFASFNVYKSLYNFLFEDFQDVVYLLPIAEMVEEMKKVAKECGKLSIEERNLLSVAYKNVIGARRASWRVLSSLEKNQKEKDANKSAQIGDYRKKVETELKEICSDILKLLDEHLIPGAGDGGDEANESKVFYHKM